MLLSLLLNASLSPSSINVSPPHPSINQPSWHAHHTLRRSNTTFMARSPHSSTLQYNLHAGPAHHPLQHYSTTFMARSPHSSTLQHNLHGPLTTLFNATTQPSWPAHPSKTKLTGSRRSQSFIGFSNCDPKSHYHTLEVQTQVQTLLPSVPGH